MGMTGFYRITKTEWAARGGLRNSDNTRRQAPGDRWIHYARKGT